MRKEENQNYLIGRFCSWEFVCLWPQKAWRIHASSPCKSFFREFSQKVLEPLCHILSMCMPFPGGLHFCSPPLLAEGEVPVSLWTCVNPGGLQKWLSALWAVRGDLGKGSIRPTCIYFSQKVTLLQMDLGILGIPSQGFTNTTNFSICI